MKALRIFVVVDPGEDMEATSRWLWRAVERYWCVALRVSGGDARTAADCFVYNPDCHIETLMGFHNCKTL